MWHDPGNIKIAHRYMNVIIGTKAPQFPEMKYIEEIFGAVLRRRVKEGFLSDYHRMSLVFAAQYIILHSLADERSLCSESMDTTLYIH
jgi:hypothetical protein